MIAHRGASALAPENTLAAFRMARHTGAIAAECDLHLSSDGELVVLHDDTLDRTSTGRGPVARQPWSALSTLDAGSWFGPAFTGEPLPRLCDVLTTWPGVLCIELKAGVGLAARVAAEVQRCGAKERVVIFSFEPLLILESLAEMPWAPVLQLVHAERYAPGVVRDLLPGVSGLGVWEGGVERAIVKAAHRIDLPVFVYTVDGPQAVARMMALGVDGFVSNDPAAALAVMASGSRAP